MSVLKVSTQEGSAAFDESVAGFVNAVANVDDWTLLGASRCHGWSRLDVVTHVVAGLQEMLGAFGVPTVGPPTHDAASYWVQFAEDTSDDPVDVLLAQRRRSDSYARPTSAIRQLAEVAVTARAAAAGHARPFLGFQGMVLTTGDFLATWAVEHTVHQLDLALPGAVPGAGLALARRTVETLLDVALPGTDTEVVLQGSGRVAAPDAYAHRLPVLG